MTSNLRIRDSDLTPGTDNSPGEWSRRYAARHAWHRITEFPAGVQPPRRVRIYRRTEHFMLQVWDPSSRKNVAQRVDGDLVCAIAKAREIEARLETFKTAAEGPRRVRHAELVSAYMDDLQRRADAGEIDARTVRRYRSAVAHYERFVAQPAIETRYPFASRADRTFALEFAAFLSNLQIAPNGHPRARKRRMASPGYVEATVAQMFKWACDPQRGRLLPAGFYNPFAGRARKTTSVAADLFGEPDITVGMAAEFLAICDRFQLPLFSLISLYGLRAAEVCFLFHEQVTGGWLSVSCDPALGYLTKGRRDKRLPLPDCVPLPAGSADSSVGLLFVRRGVADGREKPSLLGAPLSALRQAFADRCARHSRLAAANKTRIRDQVLAEAGGLTYDHVEHEFRWVARRLNWPPEATLKDFRHLFSTLLQNAGMPEFYRRYLMGHSPGRTALVTYSHLNELRERYEEAAERTLQPLVQAVRRRAAELAIPQFNDRSTKLQ